MSKIKKIAKNKLKNNKIAKNSKNKKIILLKLQEL